MTMSQWFRTYLSKIVMKVISRWLFHHRFLGQSSSVPCVVTMIGTPNMYLQGSAAKPAAKPWTWMTLNRSFL